MTIWCPFDTEDSLFVKLFRQRGYTVIATHIANGQDFFAIDPPKCDYIISNPPYSLKGEVFERLFQLNIPFAMLVGVVGLFESQKRFKMFREHDFEIMSQIAITSWTPRGKNLAHGWSRRIYP